MLPEPGAEDGVSQSAPARAGQPLANRFKQASQSGGSGFAAGREDLRPGEYVPYSLNDLPDGPAYDPRQRHRALDPWDLLEDDRPRGESRDAQADAYGSRLEGAFEHTPRFQDRSQQWSYQPRPRYAEQNRRRGPEEDGSEEYRARLEREGGERVRIQREREKQEEISRESTGRETARAGAMPAGHRNRIPSVRPQAARPKFMEEDLRPAADTQTLPSKNTVRQEDSKGDTKVMHAIRLEARAGQAAPPAERTAAHPAPRQERAGEGAVQRNAVRQREIGPAARVRADAPKPSGSNAPDRFMPEVKRTDAPVRIPPEERDVPARPLAGEEPAESHVPTKAEIRKEQKEALRRSREREKEERSEQKARSRRASAALEDEALPPPDGEDFEEYGDDGSSKRSKMFNILFWVLIGVLVCAIAFFGIRYLDVKYGGIGAAFSAWFGGEGTPQSGEAIVETTEYEGMPAHKISVYGKDGDTVFYKDVGEKRTIQNGGWALTIVDLNWVPEEPDPSAETIEVIPQVSIISQEDGTETPVELPAITVAVEKAELSLSQPQAEDLNAIPLSGEEFTISGKVEAGTPTRLYLGEEEITSLIGSDGSFTYTGKVEGYGTFAYELRATLSRHRENTIPLTFVRERAEVTLTVDDLPEVSDETTMRVTGMTEPGAQVTVDGEIEGDVTVEESGKYAFTAVVGESYGVKTYTITATVGDVSSTQSVDIRRVPEVDSYSRSAQVLDYKHVLRNPNDSKGKIFRIDGTVQTVTEEGNRQVILFYVDNDSDKPVTLDYYGTATLAEGEEYRIFCDANGNTEEPKMPRMNAWFAYTTAD